MILKVFASLSGDILDSSFFIRIRIGFIGQLRVHVAGIGFWCFHCSQCTYKNIMLKISGPLSDDIQDFSIIIG